MMSETEKPDSHPGEGTARAYIARSLPEEEAERFEEHYFACERCWLRVRQALELREALVTTPAVGPGQGRPPAAAKTSAGWRALAAAAVVLVAVTIGLWTMTTRRPALRGPATALTPAADVVDGEIEVEWGAIESADIYRIELFAHDGTLLIAAETTETRIALAADELSAGDRSGPLLLRVQALDRLRSLIAASPLVTFRGADGADRRRE